MKVLSSGDMSRKRRKVCGRIDAAARSQRQAVPQAQSPISCLGIWPLFKSRQLPRSSVQIGFRLFSVKIRIVPPYNAPLHHKRRASCNKRGRKRSSCKHTVAASVFRRRYIAPRRRDIWFHLLGQPCITASGKFRIGLIGAVIGAN